MNLEGCLLIMLVIYSTVNALGNLRSFDFFYEPSTCPSKKRKYNLSKRFNIVYIYVSRICIAFNSKTILGF